MPWKIFPSFLPHNTRNLASWIFVCHQNFTVLFTPFKYNSMLQIKQVYFKRLLLKCIYNQINCMFIVVCDLGVSGLFWPKNLYKKIDKIHEDFELYHIFICPKTSQYLPFIYCWHVLEAFLTLPIRFFKIIFIRKNWLYSFFLIFWHAVFSPSCLMPCYMH